jgi:hypothetical protein
MKDIVIAVVLIAVLAMSIGYIVKAKKNGAKCIGCPSAKECGSNSSCNCGCNECNTDVH